MLRQVRPLWRETHARTHALQRLLERTLGQQVAAPAQWVARGVSARASAILSVIPTSSTRLLDPVSEGLALARLCSLFGDHFLEWL